MKYKKMEVEGERKFVIPFTCLQKNLRTQDDGTKEGGN